MTSPRPLLRSATVVGALALAAALLPGCAPDPAPSPTPTAAFSSEEEAFAAAEETYRAYNDAVNAERSGEQADPYAYLIGSALEQDIQTDTLLVEEGKTLTGDGTIRDFNPKTASIDAAPIVVAAEVCLDVSQTRVLDQAGHDVTPQERPNRVLLAVDFVESESQLRISSSSILEATEC